MFTFQTQKCLVVTGVDQWVPDYMCILRYPSKYKLNTIEFTSELNKWMKVIKAIKSQLSKWQEMAGKY